MIRKIRSSIQRAWPKVRRPLLVSLLLMPGALLILAAVSALVAPKLVVPLVALFALVAGLGVSVLTWKLFVIFGKLSMVLRFVQTRVVIQGVSLDSLLKQAAASGQANHSNETGHAAAASTSGVAAPAKKVMFH